MSWLQRCSLTKPRPTGQSREPWHEMGAGRMRSRDHGNTFNELQHPQIVLRLVNCSSASPIVSSTAILSCVNRLLALLFMSHAHAIGSSSSNFQLILDSALDKYKKRTKNDLLAHPLAAQLQSCNSPSAIIDVLQQQLQGLGQSRSSDERWSRWLDPTVNVVYALSSTIAAGVGLVCLRA